MIMREHDRRLLYPLVNIAHVSVSVEKMRKDTSKYLKSKGFFFIIIITVWFLHLFVNSWFSYDFSENT